ncbi:MBL fold metallo-hydrolase [Aneurinibacillus tyrosinisolvens]|uniref:MBL fold metallo-hydrolase n=1 Tax=Aneurinibacillus tyrosinisolvens TaxID=1443435 RepID=UPI00069B818B|nr:MBL fold metallo-hydrolase [Aneurinibacillus tyrosinisolvens]
MIVQRLSWAGILIRHEESTLLIDPLENTGNTEDKPLTANFGVPLEPLLPLSDLSRPAAVLVTHIHPDHFDHDSIRSAFGGNVPLVLPDESAAYARKKGFSNVEGASIGDSFTYGPFRITAAHSADGFGTPQVAWVVEAGGNKLIHCGDSLWHGFWWKIAREHGPIDIACLPINGPILDVKGLGRQSMLPAAMTPEEAVEAAAILGVKKAVPIHYHAFHNPPFYTETANPLERFMAKAVEYGVGVEALKPGELFDLSGSYQEKQVKKESIIPYSAPSV